MPQLNLHDFAPQVVWLVITFVVLYLVMSKLAIPTISDTLEKRQGKIQSDLDAAEKASEDTRALVAAYEKRLADAREEARRLHREQAEADSAAATARLTELGDTLNARIDEAEKRIAGQRARCWKASRTWRTTSPPTSTASSPASRPTRARSGPRSPPRKEAADGYRLGCRQGRASRRRRPRSRLLRQSGDLGRRRLPAVRGPAGQDPVDQGHRAARQALGRHRQGAGRCRAAAQRGASRPRLRPSRRWPRRPPRPRASWATPARKWAACRPAPPPACRTRSRCASSRRSTASRSRKPPSTSRCATRRSTWRSPRPAPAARAGRLGQVAGLVDQAIAELPRRLH